MSIAKYIGRNKYVLLRELCSKTNGAKWFVKRMCTVIRLQLIAIYLQLVAIYEEEAAKLREMYDYEWTDEEI